jgi:hypothetical protein
MAHRQLSNAGRLSLSAYAVAAMTVAASLAGFGTETWAQERTSARASEQALARSSIAATDLERAFWLCDHAATTRGVDAGTAIKCSVITEDLKARKFNGDFSAMLAWWRLNKATEHQALETAGRAAQLSDPVSLR